MKQGLDGSKPAYLGILLLGVVSLLGDIVYEGSRGVVPEYLKFLGATGLVIGLAGGLGDFLGYAMRLVSGFLVDTTRAYWFFIFLGYGLIIVIPLLGLFQSLEIAIMLVLLERIGKAVRAPSRDTVLSLVSKGVGTGKAFGIHELLDQTGAILGPLIVATLMFFNASEYRSTFAFLFIPFIMLLMVLVYTYKRISQKIAGATPPRTEKKGRLAKPFYIYTFAVLLNTVGLIPYTLILYKASQILPTQQWIVPLIYLLIQGVDAPAALLSGYAFDKVGTKILVLPFLLSVFPPLFATFNTSLGMLLVAAAIYGIVLGMQESVYRAAVSEFSPVSSRGTAYGIFNTAYGIGFLISGAIYGLLIDLAISFSVVLFYALVAQTVATTLLLKLRPTPKEEK